MHLKSSLLLICYLTLTIHTISHVYSSVTDDHADQDHEGHDHDHNDDNRLNVDDYLSKLFHKYGSNQSDSISKESFIKLWYNLINNKTGETSKHNNDHGHEHTTNETKENFCLSGEYLIKNYFNDFNKNKNVNISADQFKDLCPVILAHIDSMYCGKYVEKTNKDSSSSSTKKIADLFKDFLVGVSKISKKQWIFSLLTVFVISLAGFICVYAVSLLNESFKRYLTPFLVALAVGCLSGDALIHLIPHAFLIPSHDGHAHTDIHTNHEDLHENHHEGALKGLGALLGLYVFFIGEKLMQLKRAGKEKKHRQEEISTAKAYLAKNKEHNNDSSSESNKNGIQMNCVDDINNNNTYTKIIIHGNKESLRHIDSIDDINVSNKDLKYIADYLPNSKCNDINEHNDKKQLQKNNAHDNHVKTQKCANDTSTIDDDNYDDQTRQNLLDHNSSSNFNPPPQQTTNIIDDHSPSKTSSKKHHSHSHSHSHLHKRKAHREHHKQHENEIKNIKSNAWMAVMGDGLHNFSDGLAIGAAFATSITTGITTTIAVFCHELPHEIGNFAVLRSAGMPIKQALIFNIVSSILCFFGVIVGLMIGQFAYLSNWILLFISGTFLYISLVDMIPELSEIEDTCMNFFIQFAGMILGAGIMLTIALFEERIAKMLNS